MAKVKMYGRNGVLRQDTYRFSIKDKSDEALVGLKIHIRNHNEKIRQAKEMVEGILNNEVTSWDGTPINISSHTGRYYLNLSQQPLLRVKLQARGPRAVHARASGQSARRYDAYLPHKYATHYDVYVHKV